MPWSYWLAGGFSRWLWPSVAVLAIASTLAFAPCALAQPFAKAAPARRAPAMDRLIDAVASRNEAPKLRGETRFAFPSFSAKFDWNDQKRVQAAAWTLSQDASNDLWGCLMEHVGDKRYSGTCEIDENFPCKTRLGTSVSKLPGTLRCAQLLHLAPGKTSHYGGPTFNYVSEKSRDFLPNSVQVELHYARHLDSRGGLVAWYRGRKGKPLYELQIEVCQWAIKTVEDARERAEEPKKQFIAAVKKQIESRKPPESPPSKFPLGLADEQRGSLEVGHDGEAVLYERDWVLRQKNDMTEYYKWIDSKERKQLVERIKAQKAAEEKVGR